MRMHQSGAARKDEMAGEGKKGTFFLMLHGDWRNDDAH
jgi:hypothetical protein